MNEGSKSIGMRDTELYERLLGLKEPWKVKAVKMDVEGRRVEVEVECAERTIWASPEGRQRLHIHGWETRSWRHLDTCGFATVIRAEVLRVKDEKGQTATVAVPWAEKFSRFTRGFEAFGVEGLQAARSLRAAWRQLLSEFFAFRSFFFQFSHELALPIKADPRCFQGATLTD